MSRRRVQGASVKPGPEIGVEADKLTTFGTADGISHALAAGACVRGLTNAEIARQLGISVPMVRDHLNAVFAKVGATNRTEAAVLALRRHLLKM